MANTEQLFFDNIPTVREDKPGGGTGDESAAELIAEDPEKRVGTAIMLRVMPGDQFTIRADAYFDQESEEQGTLEPNELVESLLTTLMGGHTYDGIPLEELPENLQVVEQTIGHPETANTLENIISTNYNPDYPKAHLNILFFDGETMELNEEYSKVLQVTEDNTVSWGTIEPYETEIPIDPGYLVVFVDNQSIGRPVWFDNINIEHYNSQVLEENHYYPFGLTLAATGTSATAQPYKYNTKELEKSFGLEMYDYGARQHDPQLGRFWHVDPMAHEREWVSPYNFVQNNPINRVDPTGAIDNPIYDTKGQFLGTDEKGLEGKPIVMKKEDFKQGMKHEDAAKKDLAPNGGTEYYKAIPHYSNYVDFYNHYNDLPNRPDYDGYLTKAEADAWWKGKSGQSLFVDQRKIELPGVTTVDFDNTSGNSFYKNFIWGLSNTGQVYGTLKLTLLNANTGAVHLGGKTYMDEYDYKLDGRPLRDAEVC